MTAGASHSLRIHGFVDRSLANGPGVRAVLWVQGCSLYCHGCFNPAAQSRCGGVRVSIDRLFEHIAHGLTGIEGLTVSGGEPLDQCHGLRALLLRVRRETELSVIVLTGYNWQEINESPDRSDIIPLADVIIAGRYDHEQRISHGLRGSANKTVHFLTTRYSQKDLDLVPDGEVVVEADGAIVVSGIDPLVGLGNMQALSVGDWSGSGSRRRAETLDATVERLEDGRRATVEAWLWCRTENAERSVLSQQDAGLGPAACH